MARSDVLQRRAISVANGEERTLRHAPLTASASLITRFGHERQSVCCGAPNALIIGSTPGPAGDLRYGLGCNMELGIGVFVELSLRVLAQAPYQVDETLARTCSVKIGAKNVSSAFWPGHRFPARASLPSALLKRQTVSEPTRIMPRNEKRTKAETDRNSPGMNAHQHLFQPRNAWLFELC